MYLCRMAREGDYVHETCLVQRIFQEKNNLTSSHIKKVFLRKGLDY